MDELGHLQDLSSAAYDLVLVLLRLDQLGRTEMATEGVDAKEKEQEGIAPRKPSSILFSTPTAAWYQPFLNTIASFFSRHSHARLRSDACSLLPLVLELGASVPFQPQGDDVSMDDPAVESPHLPPPSGVESYLRRALDEFVSYDGSNALLMERLATTVGSVRLAEEVFSFIGYSLIPCTYLMFLFPFWWMSALVED